MTTENFDINALLDGTLDALADLPEFKPYPPGTYRVRVTLEQKVVNKHPGFELKMSCLEVIELANGSDTPPAEKAECTILYLLDNEIGQGQFKKLMQVAAAHFGAKPNRELIGDMQNAECLVVTKQRPNKEKTQMYTDLVEIQIV